MWETCGNVDTMRISFSVRVDCRNGQGLGGGGRAGRGKLGGGGGGERERESYSFSLRCSDNTELKPTRRHRVCLSSCTFRCHILTAIDLIKYKTAQVVLY